MVQPEEIIQITDRDVETLFPETLKENLDDLFTELYAIWKPNRYKALYYKLRHFVRTGQWPVRVWEIPWTMEVRNLEGKVVMVYPRLDQKRFNMIHKQILRDEAAEQELWNSLLTDSNPYYKDFIRSSFYKEFIREHTKNAN